MSFKIFNPDRMHPEFPWSLWAIGWLAVFKAILWLAYEPAVNEVYLRLVGWKYLLGAVPFLVCGVGLWRRERWAAYGLSILAFVDLALLFWMPKSVNAYLVESEVFLFSVILSAVVMVCGGPVGDLLILCASPALFRNTRKNGAASRHR
jgi:hypothetical protein